MIDDQQIDDVARAMTSAPADEHLVEKVAARIAHTRAPRAWTWIAVPIAAAAVLIAAVFIYRREPERDAIVRRGSDVGIASAPAPRAGMEPTPMRATPVAPIAQAPAPSLDPIEIAPIALQPLVETNVIPITPIAIDRIDIAPMP